MCKTSLRHCIHHASVQEAAVLPVLAAYCRLPLFLKGDVGFSLPAPALDDISPPCLDVETKKCWHRVPRLGRQIEWKVCRELQCSKKGSGGKGVFHSESSPIPELWWGYKLHLFCYYPIEAFYRPTLLCFLDNCGVWGECYWFWGILKAACSMMAQCVVEYGSNERQQWRRKREWTLPFLLAQEGGGWLKAVNNNQLASSVTQLSLLVL